MWALAYAVPGHPPCTGYNTVPRPRWGVGRAVGGSAHFNSTQTGGQSQQQGAALCEFPGRESVPQLVFREYWVIVSPTNEPQIIC
jgi:hypothetical protein